MQWPFSVRFRLETQALVAESSRMRFRGPGAMGWRCIEARHMDTSSDQIEESKIGSSVVLCPQHSAKGMEIVELMATETRQAGDLEIMRAQEDNM